MSSVCRWSPTDDDDNVIGPACGAPASWWSCVPFISAPTCDKHKCRCAKPIDEPLPRKAKVREVKIRTTNGTITIRELRGLIAADLRAADDEIIARRMCAVCGTRVGTIPIGSAGWVVCARCNGEDAKAKVAYRARSAKWAPKAKKARSSQKGKVRR